MVTPHLTPTTRLTPSSTAKSARLAQLVQSYARGRCDELHNRGSWVLQKITPSQYQALLCTIEAGAPGYLGDKLRHDYDPSTGDLVLRIMPSAIHECFTASLAGRITDWIRRIEVAGASNEGDEALADQGIIRRLLAEAATKIRPGRTSNIVLKVQPDTEDELPSHNSTTSATKSPDDQYCYGDFRYPPFVIEVAYSQKGKNLPRLAKQYYECSDAAIKTVLTVDIKYMNLAMRKDKARPQRQVTRSQSASQTRREQQLTAAISLYRGDTRVFHNRPFRGPDGNHQPGSLSISLLDFMPDSEVTRLEETLRRKIGERARGNNLIRDMLTDHATLEIPFQDLCSDLVAAQKLQDIRDKTPSPPPLLPPAAQTEDLRMLDRHS
ncbi:hypothetical protein SLS53_009437 [Cytospora paraplurivora]|uniref:Uncharacterized protein n=1 Tax=Cytospora paraplurivora TaxID=2898453 RepID=A0AAN9U574_9PEZI